MSSIKIETSSRKNFDAEIYLTLNTKVWGSYPRNKIARLLPKHQIEKDKNPLIWLQMGSFYAADFESWTIKQKTRGNFLRTPFYTAAGHKSCLPPLNFNLQTGLLPEIGFRLETAT